MRTLPVLTSREAPVRFCEKPCQKPTIGFRPDYDGTPDCHCAQDPTVRFAPIPVIQIALTTSRKRILPAAISHSHKGGLRN